MSENSIFMICASILIILFVGDPSLIDAIIEAIRTKKELQ